MIRVSRNGPYVVAGRTPLVRATIGIDAAGDSVRWRTDRGCFPVRERYTLCRCGLSRNRPFCDGSHSAAGFVGTETAKRKPYLKIARTLTGPGLRLTDAPELCASARFCLRRGGIWSLTRRSRDSGLRRTAIAEARNCPAGRLVTWGRDGEPMEPDHEPSIAVVRDPEAGMFGPLWVRGGIRVVSARGAAYETRNRVTLCRCGHSHNKPFCDGSHIAR